MARIRTDLFLLLCLLSPLICCGFVVISSETSYIPRPIHCNSGQGYWCKNITTAVECRALKHCIKGVWEKQVPIEKDPSTVCQTCIDMVKEARDQLESNETQAEIKQVLEGTCKIIPVKVLKRDCEKLMDDFGSYLVDTLASEMNPQVVCSVAGLCNNPAFERLNNRELTCDSCFGLMQLIEDKIETASDDDLRTALISVCGNFGSYSDACSSHVVTYLSEIAFLLNEYVKAAPVCTMAGVCTEKFHSHAIARVKVGGDTDVEVISDVEIEGVDASGQQDDDLPCELCEQLVKHLRDVIIANTTEAEFKQVLLGICGETKFKDECTEFIQNYYDTLYSYLAKELDGKVICAQIGICPESLSGIIRPLLPANDPAPEDVKPISIYQRPMLVLDPYALFPKAMLGSNQPQNQMICSFCEYFLHFVQQEITLPSSEKKIRDVVEKACDRLPHSVSEQCSSFIETYTDAFIALLANRIDPSQVCPGLGVCPGSLMVVEYKDKPTCPLCLLAMEEVLRKVSNKTEEDINDALDDLCIRDVFPNSLTTECATFITSYREPLTDMIVADFTPEEACVYSNICSVPQPSPQWVEPKTEKVPKEPEQKPVGSVETNEINDKELEASDANTCVLCEFIMTKLEKILKDKTTEEEIKEAVYKICNYMPHTVTAQCKTFVDQYAELVFELLINEVTPKEVCQAINLCGKASALIQNPMKRCLTCEVLMNVLQTIITNEDIDSTFNKKLEMACQYLPIKEISMCREIVRDFTPQIEAALKTLPIGSLVCRRVGICGSPHCGLGPSFWCQSEENATMCQERDFCKDHVWNKNKEFVGELRQASHLKGMDVI